MPEEKLIRLRLPEMVDTNGTPEQRMDLLLKLEIKTDEDYKVLG